jgi:hypothetical protein
VPRDGDDEVVLVGTLAKDAPQRRDLAHQVVLVNRGARPDAVQQLLFTDDVVAVFEKDDEDVEGLRRDRHGPAVPPQPALDGIDQERTERIRPVSEHRGDRRPGIRAKSIAFSRSAGVLQGETEAQPGRDGARASVLVQFTRDHGTKCDRACQRRTYRIAQRQHFISFHINSRRSL